jgi:hypothetical protein
VETHLRFVFFLIHPEPDETSDVSKQKQNTYKVRDLINNNRENRKKNTTTLHSPPRRQLIGGTIKDLVYTGGYLTGIVVEKNSKTWIISVLQETLFP